MRRLLISVCLALGAALASSAAQEHGQATEAGGGGSVTLWKVANFVLLAGGLGYLIHKKGRAFFGARSRQIRQAIEEAGRMKAEAEARVRQIEQRLEGLGAEVEALRGSARQETAAEAERAAERLRQEVDKIQAQAQREIASAGQAARQQLRGYAAELAVRLAEEQLRPRLTEEVEDRLVGAAIQELGRGGGNAATGRPV